MVSKLSSGLRIGTACMVAAGWHLAMGGVAQAQQPPAPPPPAPTAEAPAAPGAPAAPDAAPASTAMANPSMTGPLTANAKPMSFEAGDFGTIYVTGAISGLGLFQSDPGVAGVGDHADHIDLSNGQLIVQKTDGLIQFFAEVGAYSFPSLGTPYFQSGRATGFYTPFSSGYIKVAPTDTFSVQAGKLPTLIGAEYAFTFQNMNIERGLLWNQEPVFSRGVQGNYTAGPLAFSLSLNDGFYSGNYDWVSGSAAWTIDKVNTLSVVGGGNFDRTTKNTLATPLAQDNSKILNVIYTYNNAPWTITPYFQYTSVDSNPTLGLPRAETWGGAILANYQINDNVNVAGRAEYISSSGPGNLLYGPGSSAASFTITPTWQDGIYFLRGDASVVQAFSTTPGLVFGKVGNTRTQARWVLEGGIIF